MKSLACVLVMSVFVATDAFASNVALGKPVTSNYAVLPVFSFTCGNPQSPGTPQPALSTITDGVFLPQFTCYQQGPYWADDGSPTPVPPVGPPPYSSFYNTFVPDVSKSPGLVFDIDLQGTFDINGAIVEADDNDPYMLQYRDVGGVYHDWWTVPALVSFGFETRPSNDDFSIQSLPLVTATGLRFFGIPRPIAYDANGRITYALDANDEVISGYDNVFGVAEIQVFTVDGQVPEPASLLLLGTGLVGTVRWARKRQAARSAKV